MCILEKLKDSFVVSCQAYETEVFYGTEYMVMMAKSAYQGGANALRVCWPENISEIKKTVPLPIIGINKIMTFGDDVWDTIVITPTIKSAKAIVEAGADILAFDGTFRNRTREELSCYIKELKGLGVPLMADISTLEEGIFASEKGVDIISSTLSGYTRYSPDLEEPDFELVANLVKNVDKLVNAEGRIWTPEQAVQARKLGAHMVTVGTAITRPEAITKQFVDKIKGSISC